MRAVNRFRVVGFVAVVICLFAIAALPFADNPNTGTFEQAAAGGRTIRDGVYSEAQAGRGAKIYDQQCASCHGPALTGGQAPALAGAEFFKIWDGTSLSDLFERVRTTMPQDSPGTLSEGQAADLLAHILAVAKLPAAEKELPTDSSALKAILIKMP